MNKIFKNLFIVLLLAMLMVIVTNCTGGGSESSEATKIAQGVQTALAEATALEATVQSRVQTMQAATQKIDSPTPVTIQPNDTPANDLIETPTTTPMAPSGPVTIFDPTDKAVVPMIIEVLGFVDKSALQGKFLNVIITTQTKQYWVQDVPDIQDNGNWSAAPVYLGDTDHGAGEEFRICAVLTGSQLRVGQISPYPEGAKMCITVNREK